MAYGKRVMATRRVDSGEEAAHRAWNTKPINGKNTADDDIPERDITDCTNLIYAIEQRQTGRAGGEFPLSGIVHALVYLLLRRIFLSIPTITLRRSLYWADVNRPL